MFYLSTTQGPPPTMFYLSPKGCGFSPMFHSSPEEKRVSLIFFPERWVAYHHVYLSPSVDCGLSTPIFYLLVRLCMESQSLVGIYLSFKSVKFSFFGNQNFLTLILYKCQKCQVFIKKKTKNRDTYETYLIFSVISVIKCQEFFKCFMVYFFLDKIWENISISVIRVKSVSKIYYFPKMFDYREFFNLHHIRRTPSLDD